MSSRFGRSPLSIVKCSLWQKLFGAGPHPMEVSPSTFLCIQSVKGYASLPPLHHDNMIPKPRLHLHILRIPGGTGLQLIRRLLKRNIQTSSRFPPKRAPYYKPISSAQRKTNPNVNASTEKRREGKDSYPASPYPLRTRAPLHQTWSRCAASPAPPLSWSVSRTGVSLDFVRCLPVGWIYRWRSSRSTDPTKRTRPKPKGRNIQGYAAR